MGRGSSKAGGGGGKPTPSGVTYKQFVQMTDQEQADLLAKIIDDPNIKVPSYLDDSLTSKIMVALGMNGKPKVVDDATLDGMQGRELYRTVYEMGSMPPPSTDAIIDQIRYGDFTQMSGKGGSYHGRAIYFATDLTDSTMYGSGERNPMVMRAKLNPNAKIGREFTIDNLDSKSPAVMNMLLNKRVGSADEMVMTAGIRELMK